MTKLEPSSIDESLDRGWTRDDLLFIGELRDVSATARKMSIRCPVAIEYCVEDALRILAGAIAIPYHRVLMRTLGALVRAMSTEGTVVVGQEIPFIAQGLSFDLSAHVDTADDGALALTIQPR